jgi:diguanylate cyclase (GGDEF)-like protein
LPLTLVIGDVDDFKLVNDTFGHLAGDEVLRLLSRTLSTSLRNSDIVARHGGEEFGILLTETPLSDSLMVVERCRQMVQSSTIVCEGRVIKVTMSFGIALFPPGSTLSQKEWVKQADRALYEAKRQGRNRICLFADGGEAIRRPFTAVMAQ